jgi:radical SAM enzyme (TIGR01210 family)
VRGPLAADAARVRALRPAKAAVDPWRPLGLLIEDERVPGGGRETVLTVFLAGAECPLACVFCDLWRHTLDAPTPPGALPAQIAAALADPRVAAARPRRIKLYNASNFFDRRAVPPEDLPRIVEALDAFEGVTVESHPRMLGAPCLDFARRIRGRLEVAMGLETVHEDALRRIGKGATVADVRAAAEGLAAAGVDLRVFVLVGPPYVPAAEQRDWTVRSAADALRFGARVVSLIPVRGGNGALETLAGEGLFTPPTLRDLEAALDGAHALSGEGVVLADLWDVERLPACASCRAGRIERLRRLNATGRVEGAFACAACARPRLPRG